MRIPVAAVDSTFLDTVLNAYGRQFTTGGLIIIAATLAFAVVMILLALFQAHLRRERRKQEPPVGWVTKREDVVAILGAALHERSKVDLSFLRLAELRKSVSCSLVRFDEDRGVILELPATVRPGEQWKGRGADCYFRVPLDGGRDRRVFYFFRSEITEIIPGDGKTVYPLLRLRFPDHLVLAQKREFLRIAPPSADVLSLGVVPDEPRNLRACLRCFFYDPEVDGVDAAPSEDSCRDGDGLFRLADVSGEGLKAEMRATTKEEEEFYAFTVGKGCHVLLRLRGVAGRADERFFFQAVVRHMFHDPLVGATEIGLQFTGVAKGLDEHGKAVWEVYKERGCPELEQWVVQKYLEMFREKGVDPQA